MSLLEKLPPEIRNQIWFNCLVSETGYFEPIGRNEAHYLGFPRSKSSSGPFFYLTSTAPTKRSFSIQLLSGISTSLLRTNKRINAEASPIFWGNNTFFFKSPYKMEEFKKSAGIFVFNKIISMNIVLGIEFEHRVITTIQKFAKSKSKSKSTKLSPTSSSQFRLQKLQLSVSMSTIDDMSQDKHHGHPKYTNLLSGLEGGRALGDEVERRLVVLKKRESGMSHRDEVEMKWAKVIVGELRRAFEGS